MNVVESLFKKFIRITNINIRVELLKIILILLTVALILATYLASVVTMKINELLLGNFQAVDLKVFIKSIIMALLSFVFFVIPLNYIIMRHSKPNERFIKPKRLVSFFIFHILLVYVTFYLSTSLFYVITYGIGMPPEVYQIFNNNIYHLTEFQLMYKQEYITILHYMMVPVCAYVAYALFYVYRIKKEFFDTGITNKFKLILEQAGEKEAVENSIFGDLVKKIFNYRIAKIYHRAFVYYYSAVWFIYPLIILFVAYKDGITHNFLTIDLAMNDLFVFSSLFLNIIFIIIPMCIFFEIGRIYGFKITDYFNKTKIDMGISFYCTYLSLALAFFISSFIRIVFHILEKYGNIVPTINASAALALVVAFAVNYVFSKPKELLSVFLKYVMYEH